MTRRKRSNCLRVCTKVRSCEHVCPIWTGTRVPFAPQTCPIHNNPRPQPLQLACSPANQTNKAQGVQAIGSCRSSSVLVRGLVLGLGLLGIGTWQTTPAPPPHAACVLQVPARAHAPEVQAPPACTQRGNGGCADSDTAGMGASPSPGTQTHPTTRAGLPPPARLLPFPEFPIPPRSTPLPPWPPHPKYFVRWKGSKFANRYITSTPWSAGRRCGACVRAQVHISPRPMK